ncbi:MAG: hypothetical protein HYZ23_01325 [Chloroflexi bacterium]|nr:hypothetical protein [Chloroflexota bacterium]
MRGVNDVGSAVAHSLFTAGYAVVIHENPQPTVARRKMSFADAVFDGRAVLDGVEARLVDESSQIGKLLSAHQIIPVMIDKFDSLLQLLRLQILVDARMRKHSQPESQRGLAEFTIGLGPNFIAGETVDVAIETNWGDSLGMIIERGATNPLQGEPREIDGHARDRYVYAPVGGLFHTSLQIGDAVMENQEIARIGSAPILAPITGVLRGLTRDGVPVSLKTKIIEVDPRMENAQVSGIGERPARIAEGVLTAVQNWELNYLFIHSPFFS